MALAILVTSATAAAAPVTPPAGWTLDRASVDRMLPVKKLPVSGVAAATVFEAWKPDKPGAVLYVTSAEAAVPADRRDAIASAELGELIDAMRRQGPGVKSEASAQRADGAARQLEATVRWRDERAGLVTSARLVIAGSASALAIAKAECILALDVEPALATACEQALATLSAVVPRDARVELAIVSTVEPVTRPAADQPRLDDPGVVSMPPIAVSPAPSRDADRRPIYVGFGLVVMAAIFYWNRRRRERFEREDARGSAPSGGGDDDADDLHAAAEGTEDKS